MHSIDEESFARHKPFADSFLLSVRDFGGGEREVMVQRYDRRTPLAAEVVLEAERRGRMGSGPLKSRSERLRDPGPFDEAFDREAYWAWRVERAEFERKRAENRERAARRARSECAARLKAIGADRMITLTYRENMQDRSRLGRDWQKFVRRIRRVMGFAYVATHERQKRGAWHMHVAVRGRQNYRLVRSIWKSVVGEGSVNVRNPWKEKKLRHKLAAYMGKYIAKNAEQGELNERRVWCSKDIPQGERDWVGGAFTSWSECVNEAMARLDPDLPLVAWYSRRRDLMFFATSNPC